MEREWVKQLITEFSGATLEVLDIQNLQSRKLPHIPSRLYKIRCCGKYAFENLSNKTLFLGIANDFNDPYDTAFCGNYGTTGIKEQAAMLGLSDECVKAALKQPEPFRAVYELWAKKEQPNSDVDLKKLINIVMDQHGEFQSKSLALLVDQLKNSYKICSLSERLDSTVMWGHYGCNHTGFAMEYNFNKLPNKHVLRMSLWPVAYTDKLFDISHILLAQNRVDGHFNNLFGIVASLRKAMDWGYEREWRLVIADGVEPKSLSLSAPLQAVHLGARISLVNEKSIRDICESINIPVFKMSLAAHEYRMLSSAPCTN